MMKSEKCHECGQYLFWQEYKGKLMAICPCWMLKSTNNNVGGK